MPPTVEAAIELARLVEASPRPRGVRVGIAPPAVALAGVADAVRGSDIAVYAQDVHWTLCAGGFTCGTIDAPMDWFGADDGRSIEVSMIVRPADGEVWGSMLYNPGGPGASGLERSVDG